MTTSMKPEHVDLHPAVWLAPTALLALALAPLPLGYYTFLRLVVCGAAGLLAYHEYRLAGQFSGWLYVLVGIALLFNPIIEVHLPRALWVPLDIAGAVAFWMHRKQRGTGGTNG